MQSSSVQQRDFEGGGRLRKFRTDMNVECSCGLGTGAGWGEEPDGEIVMLENGGLESITRQKRTRVLLLE